MIQAGKFAVVEGATQHRGPAFPTGEGSIITGLVGLHESAEDDAMRRALATLCVCWLAYCGAPRSNTFPLAFGMTPTQAEFALGTPLHRYSGRGGSKTYLAVGFAPIHGAYAVDTALALQFRRNRLTGWKQDWLLRRPRPYI
jgi:hypothetical protein